MSTSDLHESSDCLLLGDKADPGLLLSICVYFKYYMDTFTGSLAIAGASYKIAKKSKDCYVNYRDAEKQITNAQRLSEQYQLITQQLEQLSQSKKASLGSAKALYDEVNAALPPNLKFERKRDRLKWAFRRKRQFEKIVAHIDRHHNALNLNLQLSHTHEYEKYQCQNTAHTERDIATRYIRRRQTSRIHSWKFLAKYLGIQIDVIVCEAQGRTTIRGRWPLNIPFGLGHVLTGQVSFHEYLPTLPKLVLRPQNMIPGNSEIIEACQSSNISKLRQIFGNREAHPNDRTKDNLTVFRFAVRAGNLEIVELLLEHGADPNLTFGSFETSPLNNAFYFGYVSVIRRLLRAGADLTYQNSRTWTSLSYLWDPERKPLRDRDTNEIIEICMSEGFTAWNETDPRGWTPCHRAAAYGCSDDIENLQCKGANMSSYTTNFLWGPITCAVWTGNESTFDALMKILPLEEVKTVHDSRGWTLLHFAAQKGCSHILQVLSTVMIDVGKLSMGTEYWVTETLRGERLTAERIAREYNHGLLWDEIMNRDR